MAENTVASAGVEFYGDLTKLNQDMQRAETDVVRVGNRIGEKAGRALGEKTGQEAAKHATENYRREIAAALGNGTGLMPTSAAMGSLMGGSGTVAIGGTLLSGATRALFYSSNEAARMQAYREALTGIARDATVAGKALEELKGIAAATNYSTDEVLGMGITMAGKDGNVSLLPTHVTQQLDAATAFGVQSSDFDAYQTNAMQMMGYGPNKIDMADYHQFINRARLATSAISNAYGISIPEADKKLRSATGDEFKAIIERVAASNKGLSGRMGGTTPQRVAGQMKDDWDQGAADTGELVNTALLPLFNLIHSGTSVIKDFNTATGGAAGLVGILGAATLGAKLLKAGTEQTTTSIGALTSALRGLSVAADGAASSTQAATVAEERKQVVERVTANTPGAMYDHALGRYVIPPSIMGVGAAAAAGTGFKGLITPKGPTDTPFSLAPSSGVTNIVDGQSIGPQSSKLKLIGKGVGLSLLPIALNMAGDAIAGDGQNAVRSHIGRDLSAMSTYGALGAAIGSAIPGVGTVFGGGIGSVVGLGMSEYQQYKESQNAAQVKSETAKNTDALQKNTDAVKDQTAKTIGGGKRVNWAGTQAMREWAAFGHGMPNAMISGIG